jgi:hypothetical protein
LSDNLQDKNFKISICFFSLQKNPALLMPWMVYTFVILIGNSVLYIVSDVGDLPTGVTIFGSGIVTVLLVYGCK